MEFSDADPAFRARFLEAKFEPESFVQSIASKSIGSTDLMNMKRRMHLISSEAKTELKQNVYRNHTKFIETAKEVSSLESEVYQLHSLLADEKQLLNTVKELLNVEKKNDSSETSENDSWETLLHHCQSLGLVSSNPDRRLIHSGKLLEVKLENLPANHQQHKGDSNTKLPTSYVTHQCYGLLFSDYFIIAKSANIRTATAYDVDQVLKLHQTSSGVNSNRPSDKQIPSSAIQTINLKDGELRNSFLIQHNLETHTMMCENAQSKKHWMEMFESALYPRQRRGSLLYTDTGRLSLSPTSTASSSISDRSSVQQQQIQLFEEDFYSEDWVTNTQENLVILLAERNFDEALALILRSRKHVRQFVSEHSQQTMHFVDEYVKSVQIKEQELCKLIEKEIQNICERGCSTNLLKHYYHHIQTLKQLGYVPKACDLFITIQLSLMKSTLKQTKLEELNVVFVENFANTFFTRLVDSYYEFVQIFKDQKSTFTKFIVWMSSEIEKLITILHNQQYISTKNFNFTMKNIDILLTKANEFSSKLIDVKFMFEEQLEQLLIQIITTQKDVIIDTLRQRHRDEKWTSITLSTQDRLEQLYFEFHELGLDSQKFFQPFITINNDTIQINLAPSTLQFAKAYLTFSRDLFKIHYSLINQTIVEALVELIKLHLKYYERALQKLQNTNEKQSKIFIMKNVEFSLNHLFHYVDTLYRPKIGHSVKYFTKVYEKMSKLKEMAAL
ncbi:unnamed protein product [Adineta steineri]|uniref:Exocyst complex component 8 n=1 Tax=Adineta steineri TaxID=433720 RepID=A0A814SKD4_9BILA|nr:unnamed protein product [Adineta steineri]CAF1149508.1 unnamed protein product [Adineta steineri]CAF1151293.1 unnamed protein product [Adineta steineri]